MSLASAIGIWLVVSSLGLVAIIVGDSLFELWRQRPRRQRSSAPARLRAVPAAQPDVHRTPAPALGRRVGEALDPGVPFEEAA